MRTAIASPSAFVLLVALAVWIPTAVVAGAVAIVLTRGGRAFARALREADRHMGPGFSWHETAAR